MSDIELSPADIDRARKLKELETELSRIGTGLKGHFHDLHDLLQRFVQAQTESALDAHRKVGSLGAASEDAGRWIVLAFLAEPARPRPTQGPDPASRPSRGPRKPASRLGKG